MQTHAHTHTHTHLLAQRKALRLGVLSQPFAGVGLALGSCLTLVSALHSRLRLRHLRRVQARATVHLRLCCCRRLAGALRPGRRLGRLGARVLVLVLQLR